MQVIDTGLPGVLLLEPRVFGDHRGFFLETFHAIRYAEIGIRAPFVQDNWSRSVRGALRGLHFQEPHPQGKLVQVVHGNVYDVAVDVRRGSATFGRWVGYELNEENKRQLWVPPGFAHGFVVLSDYCDLVYKCTALYRPEAEQTIAWNDPDLAIPWPIDTPILSSKDAAAPRLAHAHLLPLFDAARPNG